MWRESESIIDELLQRYDKLLARVDDWFAACLSRYPDAIVCGLGCSACCRGLFDISLLDAWVLRRGFDGLSEEVRSAVLSRAKERIGRIREEWPEFALPFILNRRPEEEWDQVDDEAPCVLLNADGLCLVYEHRPLTCRLHGLPQVDISGEVMDEEWCSMNFPGHDPLALTELRGAFAELFRQEAFLLGEFNVVATGFPTAQLATLIPAALLIDFPFTHTGRQRQSVPSLFPQVPE